MKSPWVEVVQTDAEQPWHGRIVGGNGEPVWLTENYGDRRDIVAAILILPGMAGAVRLFDDNQLVELKAQNGAHIEVRYVDERGKS